MLQRRGRGKAWRALIESPAYLGGKRDPASGLHLIDIDA
jgi:hypothetical protein